LFCETASSNALGSLGSLTVSESSDQPYFYKLYSIQKEVTATQRINGFQLLL